MTENATASVHWMGVDHLPARSTRFLSAALLSALMVCAPERAQGQGAIEGFARTQDSKEPIAFGLARLVSADGGSTGRQVVTDAGGRFFLGGVPVGSYKLQLLRIGYVPVITTAFAVKSGETIRQDIIAAANAIVLPALTVRPAGCLQAVEINDPRVSIVWDEAQRGVEIRRAFDLRYRYTVILTQNAETSIPERAPVRRMRADTTVREPDSAEVRDQRRRARNAAEGFGKGNSLVLPDEKELLDDDFLRMHCLESPIATEGGLLGLRFRPVAAAERKGYGLAGTIWVDSATYKIARLELQYLNDDKPFSTLVLEYEDVAVGGAALRLPVRGPITLSPVNAPRGAKVTGTLTMSYSQFEDVRPRP